jgi:ADP-L-glycero-D-manno-heptose 6-epimerase
MRVLVTGGGGFIGSNLAKRLTRDGHDVVAADTFSSANWRNLADFEGDVLTLEHRLDVDSIRRSAARFGAFEVIFHQAAITGVIARDGSASAGDDVQTFLRNNVEQFRQLLDLAVEIESRVIWASSCSVYGRNPPPMRESQSFDPLNIYAFSKVAKERLAGRYASRLRHPVIGLRYSNVYGPGEAHKGKLASMIHQLAIQIRTGKRPRIFAHGQQRRDFVYIDDVVEANLLALRATRSGVCNVGAGRSWSFNEVVAQLNASLGTDLQPEYFENPYGFTQDWTECDVSQAKSLIGFVPHFDLKSGIEAYERSGKLGIVD